MGIKKQFLLLLFFISALGTQVQGASIIFTAKTSDGKEVISLNFYSNPSTLEPIQKKNVFTFDNLPVGKYTFYILSDFYKNQTVEIEISNEKQIISRELILVLNEYILDTVLLKEKPKVQLGEINGDHLVGSIKSENTDVEEVNANKSTNNSRQLFYRSPFTNIVETDGAGIQLGIGGRGLDPHRSSNFNIRQNGYDISADALGYPESYYTPPAEAMEKIEVLRGAASLQYGTQFGGVVNFKLKSSYEKPIEVRSRQTYGSFNLFNSFNSIGGTSKKGVKYFAYYQRKTGDDYRPNSNFEVNNFYGHIEAPINDKLIIGIDQTYMTYLSHQPGGLSDAEFIADPRQSNRERNWFQVKWYVPAASVYYFPNPNWTISSKVFGLIAERNSVGNLGPINRLDDPNSRRDIILGEFRNIGNETRTIYDYQIKNKQCYLSSGYRLYYAKNKSTQGIGNTNSDADFNIIDTADINNQNVFPNYNLALFTENIFHVSKKLTIIPGVRFEHITTNSDGFYRNKTSDLAGNILENNIVNASLNLPRTFVIAGIGASYKLKDSTVAAEIYTNLTQNYRSVTFSDLRINNPSLLIDSALHDERGYNFDLGYRTEKPGIFDLDVSVFALHYNDKIGETLKKVPDPVLITTSKRFRSNISDAIVYGLEFFGEYNLTSLWNDTSSKSMTVFGNCALIKSQYINSKDPSIEGNQVEYAPWLNYKLGLIYKAKKISATLQSSYTSEQFSDASNANDHPSAIVGIIPSYFIMDFSMGWKINKNFKLESGINNLTNTSYYTKRTTGYPGPGILPSSGRNIYVTLEVRI